MSDPIADMLTRIRNAQMVSKATVSCQASTKKAAILDLLAREGYIRGYRTEEVRSGIRELVIELKYHDGRPSIREIKRVSRPGLRVYRGVSDLPSVRAGLGTAVLSTPGGVLADYEARAQNLGGEVICTVF